MSTSNTPISKAPRPKRNIPWKRIILIIFLIFIAAAATASVWGFLQLQKPLPQTEGTMELSGLQSSVSVHRDERGVPHIEATNDNDLYFAQGYITAQDRLFQMDLSRRQASGLLSEAVGEAALNNDKYFRTFGLRRAAEASLSDYSEESLETLDAYAAGVNAFIDHAIAEGTLPVEFRILGYKPEQWTPLDSLTIGKFMAFDLGGNWEGQAFRQWLVQNTTAAEAGDLFPSYPENGPVILESVKEHEVNVEKSFASAVVTEEDNGSNNWVVAGEHTRSGAALLANDPHLAIDTPSIWYESQLISPSMNVSGVIFAGVPGIIVGHNDDIAWGVTNVGPDVQQLYMERRNPENPYEFEYEGEWYKGEVIQEEIPVADSDPVPHEIVLTRNGPVFSEYALEKKENEALSLKWTAHEPTTELEAVLRFNKASTWEEFKEALEYFQAPAQNFVFADRNGTIAYRANGWIPTRESGEDSLLPVPGWSREYEWEGYIPWDELPTIKNPESGMISTANNKIGGDDYPYHISHTWAQPYRHQRILEVLEEKEQLTSEDMKALQLDTRNLHAKEMLPLLKKAVQQKPGGLRELDRRALELLDAWNLFDDRSEAGPLVFNLWMKRLADVLFEKDIPIEVRDLFEGEEAAVDELVRRASAGEAGPWMEKNGGFEQVALESLQRTVDQIEEAQGNDPHDWSWGAFHQASFAHPLASVWPLNYLFNSAPAPSDGSRATVRAAGFDSLTGDNYHGGGWRGVMDLNDLTKSEHVVAPGQSGHVQSASYHDQLDDWIEGNYHVTQRKSERYEENSRLLQLLPTDGG
ncbi:penicillin acylase family protein [Alteribacillus sp. HJP-4]|uniref:penicillin acylase family protein n=1 Tax=Alteribacillus sp. HJP-4 TaxID=2775394 RepID=UPI0035CD35FC